MTKITANFNGDGQTDREVDITLKASGGYEEISTEFDALGEANWSETHTETADGRTTTVTTDFDGEGDAPEREIKTEIDLSRNVTTTYRELSIDSTVVKTMATFEPLIWILEAMRTMWRSLRAHGPQRTTRWLMRSLPMKNAPPTEG